MGVAQNSRCLEKQDPSPDASGGNRLFMLDERLIKHAAKEIAHSKLTLALTGAGISVPSGIPDFRSADGLWARYDPAEYATISAFRSNPLKVWEMLREMEDLLRRAQPNLAHLGMGEMERIGCLQSIITQNIDNLHQAGGSRDVIEYHGNAASLTCLACGRRFSRKEKEGEYTPTCLCGNILKPDVIFFGEAIPEDALNRSFHLASSAQALLVVGTSAVVSPANTIPSIAKRSGACVIEINQERTHLSESITDIFLEGDVVAVVPLLVDALKKERAPR